MKSRIFHLRKVGVAALLAAGAGLSGCGAPAAKGEAEPAAKASPAQCRPPQREVQKDAKAGMNWVPPGETVLGSDRFHSEERPVRTERVEGFWIDAHEVTNREYAAFVEATGYVTYAETGGNGAAVFSRPLQVSNNHDLGQWWRIEPKASWRAPTGAGSNIDGRDDHPVINLTYDDALAYARWRGRDLPTEAEWERAARGGLKNADYTWGDDPRPGGRAQANHWQGPFPVADSGGDGFKGSAPVGCFPPNGYGLHDMAGNVWELVKDPWPASDPGAPAGARVIKGGSYLCADDFCLRYRPSARQPGDPTLGTNHTGFRTVWRGPPPKTPA